MKIKILHLKISKLYKPKKSSFVFFLTRKQVCSCSVLTALNPIQSGVFANEKRGEGIYVFSKLLSGDNFSLNLPRKDCL